MADIISDSMGIFTGNFSGFMGTLTLTDDRLSFEGQKKAILGGGETKRIEINLKDIKALEIKRKKWFQI